MEAMFEEEQEPEFEIFSALLFNSLKAITFMFFISFAMINKPADEGKVDPKAEMLVTVSWPDNNPDDVDTYVEDPAGNVIWYNQREGGLMHLDRDDRYIIAAHLSVGDVSFGPRLGRARAWE